VTGERRATRRSAEGGGDMDRRVLRVVVASPGDVARERDAVAKV
jgi:hypothetical protein